MRITLITLTLLFAEFTSAVGRCVENVYVIYYATNEGKTGHMGIAVDNYHIVFGETETNTGAVQISDTTTTGELTYYDLWPDDDYFSVGRTRKDIPANYYKLPLSSLDAITLNSLYDKGIPHKENYPCDGLLKISTTLQQDKWMISLLDSMVSAHRLFNGQQFNCADFVRIPLERLLKVTLSSNEFILTGWSTTPNQLYRNLRKLDKVEVIKNGDSKAAGSFIGQRIIFKLFHPTKTI
jgi:hypothetical protein